MIYKPTYNWGGIILYEFRKKTKEQPTQLCGSVFLSQDVNDVKDAPLIFVWFVL